MTLNGVMVKLRPRYVDFLIFEDGSRRHLGFSNFGNFNAGTLNIAKLRECAPNFVEMGQTASEIW